MIFKRVFTAFATTLALGLAGSVALAQQDDAPSTMGQVMGEMQAHFGRIGRKLSDESSNLEDLLGPVAELQAGIVKAKGMTPSDLDTLEQDVETSTMQIRRGLANALRAAGELELAILDGDREAASEVFNALREIQREGHNNVQFPLRTARNQAMLAELDDLEVSDETASALLGVFHVAEMGRNATITRNDEGKLAIQVEGQPVLDLRLQANGDLRPSMAPQVIVRPIMEDGVVNAIEVHQGGRVITAARVEE